MAEDIDVALSLQDSDVEVGVIRRYAKRGHEATTFEYGDSWLAHPQRFELEPALPLQRGVFAPTTQNFLFGAFADSAPDSWGRRLMQRCERHDATQGARTLRTLSESDYLLGVSDESRLGALRFRKRSDQHFLASGTNGVAPLIQLGRLLAITERILRDADVDGDLEMIFAPGSSLGGARPKASILDQYGNLAIAKFPKETDDYSVERWEHIALLLAAQAGINVASTSLAVVAARPVLISRRFDRDGIRRIPFVSAMTMLEKSDGERGSYPDLVDVLSRTGSRPESDVHELYRRVVFNVLISNVDDHLRNHGFLHATAQGWSISPAYDINPVPADVKPRVLSTNINLDDATCDLNLVLDVADFFNLSPKQSKMIIREVAAVVMNWRDVAARVGAPPKEIQRMQSAFEHRDLELAARV